MLDVNTIEELTSAPLELLHPVTGLPTGATLELAGANHPKRRECEFNRARALRAKVAKKGRIEMTDPADDAEYNLDRLVACTLGWKGFARNGQPIEFTQSEVRAIYEGASWIRDQANDFLAEKENFLKSTPAPLLAA